MNREQILGIIRHVLTAIGAILVIKGYSDEATMTMIVGTVMASLSGIWSIFDKSEGQVAKKIEEYKLKEEQKLLEKN
jgi:hypothetical protein